MLNQKLFNLVYERALGHMSHRVERAPFTLIEIFMVDLTAKILESKVRQSMGLFGPTASPKRSHRNDRRKPMLMSDFKATLYENHPVVTVSVDEPTEAWETGTYRGPEMILAFRNVGYIAPPPKEEEPPADLSPRDRDNYRTLNKESTHASFRLEDFDQDHLRYFFKLYGEAQAEVIAMAVPTMVEIKPRQFTDSQVIYHLEVENRLHAAAVVLNQGLSAVDDQGVLKDIRVLYLTSRKSMLDFSGHFGTEMDWTAKYQPEDHARSRAHSANDREWGDATQDQILYIEDVLSRIQAMT